MIFPLPLETLLGKPLMYLVFALIGFGFGYVLESSGFGNSKKLAAQFYFKELTVLKVMFGAIVTAMVLLFTMIGLGLLDYNGIWVNPTYLSSGILGGLIMGVGFIVGGFCPGTSLVAMATRKLDGLFFVMGGLFGIFLFGETERYFDYWWNNSGYLGRLTIQDWLNVPTGAVVMGIVLMALFMFWGSEHLERIFGGRDLRKEPKFRIAGAAFLLIFAAAALMLGDAGPEEKYARIGVEKDAALQNREVQIEPAELLAAQANNTLRTVILDVRPEQEYNLFHIRGAKLVKPGELSSIIPDIHAKQTNNIVYVVVGNDESAATEAWKHLVAESVSNVYILEGGINNWIATYGVNEPQISIISTGVGDDMLRYDFPAALGDRYECAAPDPHVWELEFIPKIKMEFKRDKSGGGCG
jgi:rhodanese-related sulfurtransferase/uncharacterized membrane protein (DUF485 family)